MTLRYLVCFLLLIQYFSLSAQEVRVIDNKGTLQEVTSNKVTTASTAPTSPVEGDVWFDSSTNISKIYDGSAWLTIDQDKVSTAATAPTTPVQGDIWFDTNTNLSKVYDGSVWKPIQSTAKSIWDDDTDTGIQVEESTDEDKIRFDTKGSERMIIDDGGKVGIGTSSPSYKLHTTGSIYANGGWFRVSGNYGLYFESHGTGIHSVTADNGQYGSVSTYGNEGNWEGYSVGGKYVFMSNLGENAGIYNDVDNKWITYFDRNDYYRIYESDGGAVAVTVNNSGHVGIGTTAPSQRLDVNGISMFRNGQGSTTYTGDQIQFGYNGTTNYKNAIRTRHNSSADIGNAIDFYTWNQGTDAVAASPTLRGMTINGGRVGIGDITSPDKTLDVNGEARVRTLTAGTVGTDEIVVADANGVLKKVPASNLNNDWKLLGNTGTTAGTNFVGTTDAQDLVFKTNNVEAARFKSGEQRLLFANPGDFNPGGGSQVSAVLGIDSTTHGRLRLTAGSQDTFSDTEGASIDLHGNSATSNTGVLDLVAGQSASGTNPAIKFWTNGTGAAGGQAARAVITGDGDVGIGVTNPSVRLHVEGGNIKWKNGNHEIDFSTPGGETGLIFNAGNLANRSRFDMFNVDNGTVGNRYFKLGYNGENTLNIRKGGNVGIGVTTPSQRLDVNGISMFRNGQSVTTYTGDQIQFGYNGGTNYKNAIRTRHNGSADIGNAIEFYTWNQGTDAVAASPTLRGMTINGGRVGIGDITSPDKTLDVNGEVRVRTLNAGATTDEIVVADTDGVLKKRSLSNVVQEPWFGDDDDAGATTNTEDIYHMGNIGIGVTDPLARLQIVPSGAQEALLLGRATGRPNIKASGTNQWLIMDAAAGTGNVALAYYESSNVILNNAGGNTGIGTAAPSQKLDVNGISMFRNGQSVTTYTGDQIQFGYNGGTNYKNAIRTRHNGNADIGNAIEFYTWNQGTDAVNASPTLHGMTVTAGRVGVSNANPETFLHVQNTNALNGTAANNISPILTLERNGTSGSKYNQEVNFAIGTYESNVSARTRMDIRMGLGNTSGVDRTPMTIRADGRVGINERHEPNYNLDVNGTFRNTNAGFFTVMGANDDDVNNNTLGGHPARGIRMWAWNDPNWGIYMSRAGAGRSLASGTAVAGVGFNQHAIRFRSNNSATNGFIFENASDQNLLSIRGSDGFTYVRGNMRVDGLGAGDVQSDVNGNLSVSSDERLKNISGNFNKGLDAVMGLQPINFRWNKVSNMEMENSYTGFSAQNVKSVIPEAVSTDDRGYLTLADRPIIGALVNSVKELKSQNDVLVKENQILKETLDDVLKRLEILENE